MIIRLCKKCLNYGKEVVMEQVAASVRATKEDLRARYYWHKGQWHHQCNITSCLEECTIVKEVPDPPTAVE